MRHLHDLAGQIKVRSHSLKEAVSRASSVASVTRWLDHDRPVRVVKTPTPHGGGCEQVLASSGGTLQQKGCRGHL